jgi:DNA-binding MarR family transcriptional regulator
MDSIRRIVRALRRFDTQAQRRLSLSGAQVFVLEKLCDGKPISINELADVTHTHQSSVSVVAQKLVDRKLVRRMRSPKDRRRVELSILPRGMAVLRDAPVSAQDRLIEAMQRMTPSRRRQLAELLAELIRETGMEHDAPVLFFEEGRERE